jgi:hypothetical protein
VSKNGLHASGPETPDEPKHSLVILVKKIGYTIVHSRPHIYFTFGDKSYLVFISIPVKLFHYDAVITVLGCSAET